MATKETMANIGNPSRRDRDDGAPVAAWGDVAKSRATVSTFMTLVESVQDNTSSDDEVVAVLSHILNTRRVSIAGRPLRVAA
jgi:hypothetical protein